MNDVFGKIALGIAGIIAIMLIGVFYLNQADFEGAWLKFKITQDKVADLTVDLERTRQEPDPTTKSGTAARHLGEEGLQVLHDIAEAQHRIDSLRKKLTTELVEFQHTVQSVRGSTTPLKAIKLRNGTTITNARFQKFGDKFVVVSHDAGVTKIDYAQLPDDLQARLRPDIEQRLAALAP